jgi:hypothetical protein
MPPTDSGFPYAHGSIGEPGVAIGTEGWNGTPFVIAVGTPASGSGHAHDFMSYGSVDGTADNTNSWVSPYTYNKLKQAIQAALPATMSALARRLLGTCASSRTESGGRQLESKRS